MTDDDDDVEEEFLSPNLEASLDELKRGVALPTTAHAALPVAPLQSTAPAPEPPPDENAGLVPIASPMVGTFYAAPDPESPPFVNVGASVGPDTAVCLIEAMKVFNEIKAEVSGTIEKIAVKNAEAVEYGQALFYVRPS